jgi:signal transduction histidine kinase
MLTATVSHEMRTPLNAIIGLLSTLTNFVHGERGHKMLQIIKNSSMMLLYLVNDMLDLYQIKNGRFQKKIERLNIRESIQMLIDMFEL